MQNDKNDSQLYKIAYQYSTCFCRIIDMLNEQVKQILQWYQSNKRELPFRQTKDPYCIWVSEVMAQQTQIKTMLPYYLAWIAKYPNVEALANANMEDVYALWAGLGYYNRARNLVKGAQYIVDNYGQGYPSNYAQWMQVPGVGPYIGAAVTSICFNEKVASIDGNVNRVISRFNALDLVQGSVAFRNQVLQQVDSWLALCDACDLNQALMEMGALVCTKSSPKCEQCPLNQWCKGKRNWQDYPIKKGKKENPIEQYKVGIWIVNDKIALAKPPYSDGLMEGYYRLPFVSGLIDASKDHIKHIYSHKTWLVQYDPNFSFDNDTIVWMDIDALIREKRLITAHLKVLKKFGLIR